MSRRRVSLLMLSDAVRSRVLEEKKRSGPGEMFPSADPCGSSLHPPRLGHQRCIHEVITRTYPLLGPSECLRWLKASASSMVHHGSTWVKLGM
jgi:hypothetical protein